MRQPFEPHAHLELGEIRIPPRNEFDAHDAVFGPDGGESFIAARDLQCVLLNHEEQAIEVADTAAAWITKLKAELHAAERRLGWTAETIVRPTATAKLSWSTLVLALLLALASGLGMIISVVVLSLWILSSASDLFANDIGGAVLLATMPALGAISLKCFEARLESGWARWLYAVILFAIGMTSLLVWLVVVAIQFSPQTGGLLAALTQVRNDAPTGIILLLATGICDLCFGASFLSGIGLLLSASRNSEEVPNLACAALRKEKLRLERSIAQWEERRDNAKAYLRQVAAGRELTRLEALQTLHRSRELFTQIQTAAQAFAIAFFLSRKGDVS